MNRMFAAFALVCVASFHTVALAQEGISVTHGTYDAAPVNENCNCSPGLDPWNYVPQPSGLRFVPAGGGNGLPCCASYNYCWAQGGCAVCAPWTSYSWYAPWPHSPCLEKPYKKHQWLH